MSQKYEIVLVDNYDRPHFKPRVIAKTDDPRYAQMITRLLNEEEEEIYGEYTPNYYTLRKRR